MERNSKQTAAMGLHFRLANPADLEAVFNLYMDPDCNRFLTYDQMHLDGFEKIYSGLLTSETLYVAEGNGSIAGSYRLIPKTYRQARTIYLGGFVVSPALKGRGIGGLMMEHIKKDAEQKGYKRIDLTVDLRNRAAIALYIKMGFEFEGRLRMSYQFNGEGPYYDEYLMGLIL